VNTVAQKKTKIICTIGPESVSPDVLREMHRQGMDGVRINTAYNDVNYFRTIVKNVRAIADIPVLIDVKGPNVRINATKRREVTKGDRIIIGFHDEEISFNYDFYEDMDVGDSVLIDNGRIETKVLRKDGGVLQLLVLNDGVIDDRKGVNVPRKKLSVPPLSEKDTRSIKFAVDNDCEYIALSFTRGPQDVENVRRAAEGFEGAVIAKIENFEGVDNFERIVKVADSIMVARGDLGVEIQPERVPLIQKWMIRLCNNVGKTVITATDILESMINNPIPTRSEASDVANTILDGTDAIMTSGETAIGKYPVETVSMITRIADEVEPAVRTQVAQAPFINISETISHSIQRIARDMPLDKIVTLTRSGYTARMISRFKLKQEIIAVTPSKRVRNQLEIAYGVNPVWNDYLKEKDRILSVAKSLHSEGLVEDDDIVLFTASFRTVERHSSNLIEIHKIREILQLLE
jgi:pyruvate kinase